MRTLLAGIALCLSSIAASASTSVSVKFHGLGFDTYNAYSSDCHFFPLAGGCVPAGRLLVWDGVVTAELSNDTDGVYALTPEGETSNLPNYMLSFSVDSNLTSFSFDHSSSDPAFNLAASVTLLNGALISISAEHFPTSEGETTFSGATASYGFSDALEHCSHCDNVEASATIGPIPEPTEYAMIASGLALVGWAKRRTSRR